MILHEEIVIGMLLGVGIGFALASSFVVWCHLRIKQDASLIEEAHDVIRSCSKVQGETIKFFQENEKKLNIIARKAIKALCQTEKSDDALFLMEDHRELEGKRNLGGLDLNSMLLTVAEKVAKFDKGLRKRGIAEGPDPAPENEQTNAAKQPILRLVVNNVEDDSTQKDHVN